MNKLGRYDVVIATFQPKRIDDLKDYAKAWIGVRMRWIVAWEVDTKDHPYFGQLAMIPYDSAPPGLPSFGWAPLCDFANITGAIELMKRSQNPRE